MQWELDEVERPFVEQLSAMGWRFVAGDLDLPAKTGLTIIPTTLSGKYIGTESIAVSAIFAAIVIAMVPDGNS